MYHSFDTEIACKYGVNAAVIFNHISFWIEKNAANNSNYYDGEYWTYSSIKGFKEIFCYMTENQIRTALKKLTDNDVLIIGNYNKLAYDRTLWYALGKIGKSIYQKSQMDLPKITNGFAENHKSIYQKSQIDLSKITNGFTENHKPIPDIITDNNTDIITDNNIKPVRHKYGEYKNVLLSDKEIEKLKAEIPNYQRYIENLSSYMMSTGKTYKSHLATIRNWARKDGVKPPKTETDEERIRREQNEQLLRAMGEI